MESLVEGLKEGYQQILLLAGLGLFLITLVALIYFIFTDRSIKPLYALFLITVLMMGFPGIKKFEFLGLKAELKDDTQKAEDNPGNPQARRNLAGAINRLESFPNLKASTQLTLSEGYAQLKDKEKADRLLSTALAREPSLKDKEPARIVKLRTKMTILDVEMVARENIQKLKANPSDTQARGKLAQAINSLESSPNLWPSTQLTLSEGYVQLENTEKAGRLLRTALERNPSLRIEQKERVARVTSRIAPDP